MRRPRDRALAGALALALLHSTASAEGVPPDTTLDAGKFGTATLYRETPHPSHVALFLSGDGGWNLGVVDMARALSRLDCLVVGLDVTRYLQSLRADPASCASFAEDLESLSQSVQQRLGFPGYVNPVLVGYSSGAAVAYAAIVQAPPNTFRGAMSLGFCPDLPLATPVCPGEGLRSGPGPSGQGVRFRPAPGLATPWIAFQGEIDQVCDAESTKAFVAKTGHAELVPLPKVGHGFSVQANWMPQFRESFAKLTASAAGPLEESVQDLPLVEVPATADAGDLFAVILSGDGGWASLDREVGEELAARGVPVIGWSSLHYFWNQKTPDAAAKDLERVIRAYRERWNRKRVILIGYSLGADVLPFMARRLPPDVGSDVAGIVLIGAGRRTTFRFRVTDWLHLSSGTELPVLPEAQALKAPVLLCFQGEEEKQSLCPELQGTAFKAVTMAGGHHFRGDYRDIADRILREVRPDAAGSAAAVAEGNVVRPDEDPAAPTKAERVTLDLRGLPQTLRVFGPPEGPTALVSSGDGGWVHLAPEMTAFLVPRGWRVIGFDAKAYLSESRRDGKPLTEDEVREDYRTLVDWAARGATGRPVLIGVSEGAGLSVLAAGDPQVKAAVAGVIALGLPTVNELGWRRRDDIIYLTHGTPDERTFRSSDVIGAVAPLPLAAIHSTNDRYAPVAEVRDVLEKAGEPKKLWVVEAENHRFSGNLEEVERRLLEALAWMGASAPAPH